MGEVLDLRFSADPDDAFAWWGVLAGLVPLGGEAWRHVAASVHENNAACRAGVPDIAAVSSAAYPSFAADYALLSPGASVGRGYGPALIGRKGDGLSALREGPVAIAGEDTTGAVLLRLLHPEASAVEMPWREIPAAVARGTVAAGVAIHETLMTWEELGLGRIECLGCEWTRQTGLPIPVGLVVAHRRLGRERIGRIAMAVRQSMEAAMAHRGHALEFARGYSVAERPELFECYVDRFANQDTIELAPDAIESLRVLFSRMRAGHLCACEPEVIPVRPGEPVPVGRCA